MPTPTLVATPKATDANTFVTVERADALLEAELHADTWRAATHEHKAQALVTATRALCAVVAWAGGRTTATQALEWPRIGLVDRGGFDVDEDTIPVDVERATTLYAQAFLSEDRLADSDLDTLGVRSLTVGSVSLTFDGGAQGGGSGVKPIPDAVWYLIAPWGTVINRNARGGSLALVRA